VRARLLSWVQRTTLPVGCRAGSSICRQSVVSDGVCKIYRRI